MFSVMGPPQLGENKAPDGYVIDAAANLCHKCGQQWDEHERVHTGSMTCRRCPVAQGWSERQVVQVRRQDERL